MDIYLFISYYFEMTARGRTRQGCGTGAGPGDECPPGIPGEVQDELEAIGGIEGLKSRLPTEAGILEISSTHHALSDPVRVTILHLLAVQPLCVCVIRSCLGIPGPKLSYHLSIMKESGLVDSEYHGNWLVYRLTDKGRGCTGENA
jgi:ArsR family transcriptional regulator